MEGNTFRVCNAHHLFVAPSRFGRRRLELFASSFCFLISFRQAAALVWSNLVLQVTTVGRIIPTGRNEVLISPTLGSSVAYLETHLTRGRAQTLSPSLPL